MGKESTVYVNGKFLPESQARISPFDHGLLYGDGIYETLRVYDRVVFKLDHHLDRLLMSAKAVKLAIPLTKEQIKEAVAEVVRRNGYTESHIRIVITAGVGAGMGLRRTIKTPPTVLIIDVDRESLASIVKSSDEGKGLRAIIASTRSIPSGCGVESRTKHNNYLNHIMVDLEAETAGADIAISLDMNGFVTECSGANIYVVKDDTIATPPPYIGILAGITRQTVVEIARSEGVQFAEKMLTPYDIYTADEVFATSTVTGIAPIIQVDSRTIGEGKPGPITSRIRRIYNELLRKEIRESKAVSADK
jgi:branched-chain amino acid aminotransferase